MNESTAGIDIIPESIPVEPADPEQNAATEPNAFNRLQDLESAQLVPISFLFPNPHQLRDGYDESALQDLTLSIKDVGVLEPLLVARKGRKRFTLIAGHRRLEAAKRAELSMVPCIVLDLSDDEFLNYSLIENLQRADLTPFEEATAIRLMIDMADLTYREVAAKLGKSAAFVSDRLALLEMPDDLKVAVSNGQLTLKKALELAKIPIERVRRKLLDRSGERDIDQFKLLVQEEIARRQQKRKPHEKWEILPELREFAQHPLLGLSSGLSGEIGRTGLLTD